MSLTDRLHEIAAAAGAAGSGVCFVEPFTDVEAVMRERIAAGYSAGMSFTFRQPDVATDITASFAWARRLFVIAYAYLPESGSPASGPGRGRIGRFAIRDYYEDVTRILEAVAEELTDGSHRAECIRDDNRLVDRAAAVRSGVGWWGKNTMVLAPGAGPWLLLGSVVTDAPLEVSEPMQRGCGTCSACLPACPTGALTAPGVLDARKCLAYWLQAPGEIPRALRAAVEDRVYGCDDCIEACPPGSRLLDTAPPGTGDVDLIALLAMDDASLLAEYGHFYIPRRRPRYLRRNALVALGNQRETGAALLVLAEYAAHPDPLLRLHAAWSLGRIGGDETRGLLETALESESDAAVAAEIRESLAEMEATAPESPGLR